MYFSKNKQHSVHNTIISAVTSKNAVSANIKHSWYCPYTSNFWSNNYVIKGCMYIMFDMVDTAFTYKRALIIVCKFLQGYFMLNECSFEWSLKCKYCVFTFFTFMLLSQNVHVHRLAVYLLRSSGIRRDGSRQHWLWDIARKRNYFLLFSIVRRSFNCS